MEKKRERSELILLAVCLVIWFSLIFRLLSLLVVTDAVSGLTTAIFISNMSLLSLWNIRVRSLTYKQSMCICKSLAQFTKSCNMSAYEMIPCSDIAPERHTMTVPAPNKWPTLHINTHLHAGKIQGSFVVSVPGSDTSHFKCTAAPIQFLENPAFFLILLPYLRGSLKQRSWMETG